MQPADMRLIIIAALATYGDQLVDANIDIGPLADAVYEAIAPYLRDSDPADQ